MEPFVVIFGFFVCAYFLENKYPRKELENRPNWIVRAVIFNILQFLLVIIGHYTWELLIIKYTMTYSVFNMMRFGWSPYFNGFVAYIINSWVFYWYHFGRHEIDWMWNTFHQFHHSPVRIEVITSFYKHPLEIVANSVIITLLIYPILGLDLESNKYFVVYSALSEFFYHINISTPHWIGYIIQRPESHRIHHLEDRIHCENYSDLPLWDILGGTFRNPTNDICKTGFSDNKEQVALYDILSCRNVLNKKQKRRYNLIIWILLITGCISTFGLTINSHTVKYIGFISGSSPLPLVFSAYNGVETFSTEISLHGRFKDGEELNLTMTRELYAKLKGPYNRRNMYGVMFSHGPFFTDPQLVQMRDEVLKHSMCAIPGRKSGHLIKEFGYDQELSHAIIKIQSKTQGWSDKIWFININCN